MNKGLRYFIAVFLVMATITGAAYGESGIGVTIDEQSIEFENEPVIVNNRTMVPFREIFEHFDAEVTWNASERSVRAERDGRVVNLAIGSNEASINGAPTKIDSPPIIIDSRTYVPLRFIAEGLDAGVSWNPDTRVASINTRVASMNTQGPVRLGDSMLEIGEKLGESSMPLLSHYGFDWYVYNKDYENYYQVGYRNGKVVALFTNASEYSRADGFKLGGAPSKAGEYFKTDITRILKDNTYFMLPDGPHQTFKTNDSYVTLFYDEYDNRIAGIFEIAEDEEMKLDGYYGSPSEALSKSYERQIFELANTERVKKNLSPLSWNQSVHDTAQEHSIDMAANGYFSHYDLSGQSPFDRMSHAGLDYQKAGENIAAGESSAVYAHYDWMNSMGHRTAILGEYDYIGVGVAFGGSLNAYFTQHFIVF
jgi:uncharacterized protein YkwD